MKKGTGASPFHFSAHEKTLSCQTLPSKEHLATEILHQLDLPDFEYWFTIHQARHLSFETIVFEKVDGGVWRFFSRHCHGGGLMGNPNVRFLNSIL